VPAVPRKISVRRKKNLYGQNRIAEGKVPLCAGMCATKALLAGDADVVADVYRERVFQRGSGVNAWGWSKAYNKE
jgi:formate dehydrogenase iron-sulfur subunit